MEELQAKHRKEARDLQSRLTQKKKSATKKTRKGVNDECDALERELKQRQAAELAALDNDSAPETLADPVAHPDPLEKSGDDEGEKEAVDGVVSGVAGLEIGGEGRGKEVVNGTPSAAEPIQQAGGGEGGGGGGGGGGGKKRNRAKERLARRAAEQEALASAAASEATSLPDLKAAERARMLGFFKQRGLVEQEIRADGHCLYSAVADQMRTLDMPLLLRLSSPSSTSTPAEVGSGQQQGEDYRTVRATAASYMLAHRDDFEPFLEESLDEYVRKVRETGEWGGQLELMALARSYGIRIKVLQGDGRVEEIAPEEVGEGKEVWLAYYRHGFGLGEHYNSLRKEKTT